VSLYTNMFSSDKRGQGSVSSIGICTIGYVLLISFVTDNGHRQSSKLPKFPFILTWLITQDYIVETTTLSMIGQQQWLYSPSLSLWSYNHIWLSVLFTVFCFTFILSLFLFAPAPGMFSYVVTPPSPISYL